MSYPSLTMEGIRTFPRAEASATADPETPDRNISATMRVWAKPPRICPTRRLEKRTSRSVTPPRFIRSPARMKRGMAMCAGFSMVRIFNPFRSSGVLIGLTRLVKLRKPFSPIPSARTRVLFLISSNRALPKGPSRALWETHGS